MKKIQRQENSETMNAPRLGPRTLASPQMALPSESALARVSGEEMSVSTT